MLAQKSKKTLQDWEHFLVKIPSKMLLKGSISFSNRKFRCVIKANAFESKSLRRSSIRSSNAWFNVSVGSKIRKIRGLEGNASKKILNSVLYTLA